MSKQIKTETPTDADLKGNPMIGGSKGTTGATPEDLEDLAGENTIEGDTENDVNRFGGIDKEEAEGGRSQPVSDPARHKQS